MKLIDELLLFVQPLETGLSSPRALEHYLRFHGFRIPKLLGNVQTLTEALDSALTDVRNVQAEDDTPLIVDLIALIDPIWLVVDRFDELEFAGLPAQEPLLSDLLRAVGRIPSSLLIRYLDLRLPMVSTLFRAVGIIDNEAEVPAERFNRAHAGRLVQDPLGEVRALYGFFDDSPFDIARLQTAVNRMLMLLGSEPEWSDLPDSWRVPGMFPPDRPDIDQIRILAVPLIEATLSLERGVDKAGLVLAPFPNASTATLDSILVAPFSTLQSTNFLVGGFDIQQPVDLGYPPTGIAVRPTGVDPVLALPPSLRFGLQRREAIEVGGLTISGAYATVELRGNIPADVAFRGEAGVAPNGIRLALDLGKGDAATVDSVGKSLEIAFDLGLVYDSALGFDFDFGAEYTLLIPELRRLVPEAVRRLPHRPLGHDDVPPRARLAPTVQIGALEQRKDERRLDVDRLAQAVDQRAVLLPQLHHPRAVVLDPRSPLVRAVAGEPA